MSRWWQPRSLRLRLALWYALGGTVLLAGFSGSVYWFVARHMAQPLARPLQQELAEIRSRLTVGPGRELRWDGRVLPPGPEWETEDPWFELWDAEGHLVRRCWPLTERRLDRLPAPPVRGVDTLSVFRVARDLRLRVYSTPFGGAPAGEAWMIRVMLVHEPAGEALGALVGIILVALPLVVVLLVAGGYYLTHRWLKPLERMVAEAEAITADNLGRRLPGPRPDDELGRLAAAFNRTLDRLEDSFRTLDRFVADASHELRTPLTTLRTVGEVGLHRSRTVEEYREIIGSMLEEVQRLEQLVDRLLELASAEGGGRAGAREPVRLDDLAAMCVADLAILAESRSQQITVRAEPCRTETDPLLFRQALQNLLDNAMKYSPAGTAILVEVSRGTGECRVSVSDEGPGVPPGHAARLADRFYRVEDARERGPGGFGLGLAITKAYLRALGGRLEYAPRQPRGSCFSLVLPDPGVA